MGLINENWFSLFSLYTHSFPISVTRLGYFLKFMAVDFHAKVAQMISDFLGYLENGKIFCVYFWDNNWRNWASLNCNIWSHCFQRTYLPTYRFHVNAIFHLLTHYHSLLLFSLTYKALNGAL